MYKGEADWRLIGEVKRNPRIHIPIIGNGDLTTGEDVRRAFEHYGVDACMVGRATLGRPWIFKEMYDAVHDKHHTPVNAIESSYEPLSADWKLDVLKAQVVQSVNRIDEYRGILHVRRHIAATPLFKGIPDFREKRISLLRAETVDALFEQIEAVRPLVRQYAAADA